MAANRMHQRRPIHWMVGVLALILTGSSWTVLASDVESRARGRQAIQKGLSYLLVGQGEDGGWQAFGRSHPAITALAVKALAQDAAYGPRHPAVRRGVTFLLRSVQADGGIYVDGEGMPNYHTSVALMALAAVKDPAQEETVANAVRFLKKIQWDEDEGYAPDSAWYGGQGYGRSKRPDLSNTQLMLDALKDSGLPLDDPVYKKALAFVSRCQMLSETNDRPFAKGGGDGGFIYAPVGDGESKAGVETVDGAPRLRSYGSMTYAGFKSMLYAGLSRDDLRVRKAYDWIRRHYSLDANPNMPTAQAHEGLYYYFHTFARALHAWGEPKLTDETGRTHDWRADLCDKLAELQHEDGSWTNEADRWYEGNPHLVTAYAVLALQTALADGPTAPAAKTERPKGERE